MNDLISIIIPVYNSEKFLSKCLDSIINQSYSNLEIIVVDDGSTDNSGFICDKYAESDKRIKVIHKINNGVSSARNDGLSICSGNYISFVDSDDYIDVNMYKKMIEDMRLKKSKVCVCNVCYENNDGKIIKEYSALNSYVGTTKQSLDYLGLEYIQGYCCNKLYSRDVIFKNDNYITFDKEIFVFEDELFNVMVFNNSNMSLSYINDSLYHYVLHSSNTINKFSVKTLSLFEALKREIQIFENNKCDISNLQSRFYVSYVKLKFILRKNKELNIDISNIREYASLCSKVNIKNIINKKNKLKYFIARYFPIVFYLKIISKHNNSLI